MNPLIAIVGFFFPRVAILILAFATTYMSRAYDGWLWPILGFLFMPFTTLAVAASRNEHGGISGIWLALVIIAVLMDLGIIGRGTKRRLGRRHATEAR